eukprot:354526-Chlamydomonas_euryale.AAC.7
MAALVANQATSSVLNGQPESRAGQSAASTLVLTAPHHPGIRLLTRLPSFLTPCAAIASNSLKRPYAAKAANSLCSPNAAMASDSLYRPYAAMTANSLYRPYAAMASDSSRDTTRILYLACATEGT